MWIFIVLLFIGIYFVADCECLKSIFGNKTILRMLNILDVNSMGVYLIHQILILYPLHRSYYLRLSLQEHYLIAPILFSLVVLFLSLLLSILIRQTRLGRYIL